MPEMTKEGEKAMNAEALRIWREEATRILETKEYRGSLEAEWADRCRQLINEYDYLTRVVEYYEEEIQAEEIHDNLKEGESCPICTHLQIKELVQANDKLDKALNRAQSSERYWRKSWQKASMGVLASSDDRLKVLRYETLLNHLMSLEIGLTQAELKARIWKALRPTIEVKHIQVDQVDQ